MRYDVIEYLKDNYKMSNLTSYYGITRQAHSEDKQRRKRLATMHNVYVGMMHECREIHPNIGLRKMYNQLKPEGIGRDAFILLGLQEGLRLRHPTNYRKTTYAVRSSRYRNLLVDQTINDINQVWVSDLFYLNHLSEHLYVVLIMDVYSRRIVGAAAADHMTADLFLIALNRAISLRGIDDYGGQLIHHSDRGSQYASNAYTNLLEEHNIQVSMCQTVLENAHAERVNGTIKNDYLLKYPNVNKSNVDRKTMVAINSYNDRYHDSLKSTPMEYETWLDCTPIEEHPDLQVYTVQNTQKVKTTNQLSLFELHD